MHERNILILITQNTEYKALAPLILFLKKHRFNVIVYCDWSRTILYRESEELKNKNITTFHDERGQHLLRIGKDKVVKNQNIKDNESPVLGKDKLLMRIITGIKNLFLVQVIILIRYYYKCLHNTKNILRSNNINLIIIGSEEVQGTKLFITISGNKLKIPSLIVPFTISTADESSHVIVKDKKNHVNFCLANSIFGKFFPHWVYTFRNIDLLRLPLPQALAMELLGLSPPLPWILNSGHATSIAVESKFMFDFFVKEGLPLHKLHLTGTVSDDEIHNILLNKAEHKRTLYDELAFNGNKPMVLISLPPNACSKDISAVCDFQTGKELLSFMIRPFNGGEFNIVINLHPRITYEQVQFIQDAGIKVSSRSAEQLIPLCDIFVVSISSVIKIAVACGKPVLNYDFMRFFYREFRNAPGVFTIYEKNEYLERAAALVKQYNQYDTLNPFFRKYDGKSGERVLNLIHELLS